MTRSPRLKLRSLTSMRAWAVRGAWLFIAVRFPAFFQHAYYKGLKNDMLAYSVSNFVHELISVGCIYIYLNGENKLHKMNCFIHNDYRQRKECYKSAKRVRDNVPYWPLSRQKVWRLIQPHYCASLLSIQLKYDSVYILIYFFTAVDKKNQCFHWFFYSFRISR